MDAFTSGSIPTHLVTLEAVEELLEKHAPDGAIGYHISNHHLDLLPVLAAIADRLQLHIRINESPSRDALHMYPARWVLLTRNTALVDQVDALPRWRPPGPERTLWVDEASNIWSVLK